MKIGWKELIVLENDNGTYIKARIYNNPEPGSGDSLMIRDFTSMFPYVKIVEIVDIYVHPDERLNGIGTFLLKALADKCKDAVILAAIGASMKEYKEEPSEDTIKEIVKNLLKFYTKNGFESINYKIANYQFKEAVMYTNNSLGEFFIKKIKGGKVNG